MPNQAITTPKVSVIIPTYNRVDSLHTAIRSVLAQTEQDFEIIVVDDVSSTDPAGVIDAFKDSRIKLIRHGQTKGGGAARNTGIRSASGDYIAFLDDDDEWLPEKLGLQLARFNSDDRPGMVYTGFFYIEQRSGCTLKVFLPGEQQDLHRRLLKRNVIGTTSTIMVRRNCFTDELMFDELLRSCQDWDFYLKIMKHFTVGCVGRPLVKYYVHENSITRNYADSLQGHRAILRRVMMQTDCSPAEIRYHHLKIGKLAIDFADKRTGRQELLRSLSFTSSAGLSFLYLLASFLPGDIYREGSRLITRLRLWITSVRGSGCS